jgi:hypothetical protein
MKKLTIIILLLIVSGNIFSQSDLIKINEYGVYDYNTSTYNTSLVSNIFIKLEKIGNETLRITFEKNQMKKIVDYTIIEKVHAKYKGELHSYTLIDPFNGVIQLKYDDKQVQILCGFDYSNTSTSLFNSYFKGDFIY